MTTDPPKLSIWRLAPLLLSPLCCAAGVAFSPDGRLLAATQGSVVRLWELAKEQPSGEMAAPGGTTLEGLAFSPDGKWLAASGALTDAVLGVQTGLLVLWDVEERRVVRERSDEKGRLLSAPAFFPDSARLAVGVWDAQASLEIWKVPQGLVRSARLDEPRVRAAAVSADGKWMAAVSAVAGGKVWLLDAAGGAPARALAGPCDRATSAAFFRDGKRLITGCAGYQGQDGIGAVLLWKLPAGTLEQALVVPGGAVWAALSPDGAAVAAVAGGAEVHLFKAGGGRVLARLSAEGCPLASAAFSADGKRLAAAGGRCVRLWDIEPTGFKPRWGVWEQ